MPYSDFTLKKVKENLGIALIENQVLFETVPELAISDRLAAILDYNVPLAMAIDTEKARSELIIANMLLEVRRLMADNISLFSGVSFEVDKTQNLTGYCDFILSATPEQFYVSVPVVMIVEAKNEHLVGGLGQCIAEMYAAHLFNSQENCYVPSIYGVVTTGNTWKFLHYQDHKAYIDLAEYHIGIPSKIIGILMAMMQQDTSTHT